MKQGTATKTLKANGVDAKNIAPVLKTMLDNGCLDRPDNEVQALYLEWRALPKENTSEFDRMVIKKFFRTLKKNKITTLQHDAVKGKW